MASDITPKLPYHLNFLNGSQQGQKINFSPDRSELILGRSKEADIVLDDKNISRKHARFHQDIDGVSVEDLKSKNGVWVNGHKISEPVLLKDSDQIQLGDLKLSFTDDNAAIIKRLDTIPAFQEAPPVETHTVQKKEEKDISPPATPTQTPAPWLDYVYIGLMVLIILGLLIGAFLWIE